MRSLCRTFLSRAFLAAILLTAAAGAALAQDPGAVPPPSAPPVLKPAAELPSIPFAAPAIPPASEPALAVEPTVPTVPTAPSIPAVAPPVVERTVATTVHRVTKTSARKPAAKPKSTVQMSESFQSGAPAPSAVAAGTTVDAPPPVAAVPVAVPAASVAVAPVAPAPPAAKAPIVENPSETTTTTARTTMGLGGWLLFGVGVLLVFGAITAIRLRRTRMERQPSIVDFTGAPPQLAPALVRPRR